MRGKFKYASLFICLWTVVSGPVTAQPDRAFTKDFNTLTNTHDIRLSPWGPYSKKYAGVSHIADMASGMRFDVTVVPSFASKLFVPNVLFKSDYYPWEVNNDLTCYSYRYELAWKDQVYVDASYQILDSASTLVALHFMNHTDIVQDIGADLMAFIDYPENYATQVIDTSKEILWTNAVDYQSLIFSRPGPMDYLPNNGWLRGEVRGDTYFDGRAVRNFGRDKGDQVSYRFRIPPELSKGNLAICYQLKAGVRASFRLTGMIDQLVTLTGTGDFAWKVLPYSITSGAESGILQLESAGGEAVLLNGLLILPSGQQPSCYVKPQIKHLAPKKTVDVAKRTLILKYPDIPVYYGLTWERDARIREIKNDELDIFFRKKINDHVSKVFNGNNKGNYTDISLEPVSVKPGSEKTVYALLCAGSYEAVTAQLENLNQLKSVQVHNTHKDPDVDKEGILPAGKKYRTAWQLLKATLMTNIVYPIYTQNSFIRHFTPGKWWNSIYTWDLGFVALGLNEINPALAAECINAYTTPVGSPTAFILHGSPVPTQMYAFFDLWNKTQSGPLLSYFYPRLKQYYNFLVGKSPGATTRKFKSNLLSTWDYFYNSGGWDDYPAQVALHHQHGENKITPVITTAQCIRVAKMLRMAALQLHLIKDTRLYDKDIELFSQALQKYAWDTASHYFSYVVHSQAGLPVGHFKNKDSVDYNMGLDGAYPLLAGICTPQQQNLLLDKIFSPNHMWTPAGISVVDQAAPYYRTSGYWNGKVWMPHQWFMWKTMLDLGRPDLAFKIADKALQVYQRELDASYSTFEYFSATSKRGGGWHQFSGLSSPVLNWFSAYYKIGTVTTGFEIWISRQQFNKDFSTYTASLSFDETTAAHERSLLVCMNPSHRYKVTFEGKQLQMNSPYKGLLEITLPPVNKAGKLVIQAMD